MLLYSLANLDDEQIKTLQEWEKKHDKRVLAFQGHPVQLDTLAPEDLAEIQRLEKQLGVTLVAVK